MSMFAFSMPASLIKKARDKAQRVHGERGLSKYAREVFSADLNPKPTKIKTP